jgi:hypothetical protein
MISVYERSSGKLVDRISMDEAVKRICIQEGFMPKNIKWKAEVVVNNLTDGGSHANETFLYCEEAFEGEGPSDSPVYGLDLTGIETIEHPADEMVSDGFGGLIHKSLVPNIVAEGRARFVLTTAAPKPEHLSAAGPSPWNASDLPQAVDSGSDELPLTTSQLQRLLDNREWQLAKLKDEMADLRGDLVGVRTAHEGYTAVAERQINEQAKEIERLKKCLDDAFVTKTESEPPFKKGDRFVYARIKDRYLEHDTMLVHDCYQAESCGRIAWIVRDSEGCRHFADQLHKTCAAL